MIAHLKSDQHTYFATGTAAPCTGIFKPIWFNQNTLPGVGPAADGYYNSESLWWDHEKFHRTVLLDFATRLRTFQKDRDEIEKAWIKKADHIPKNDQWDLTQLAFRQAWQKIHDWTENIRSLPAQHPNKGVYRRYWKYQNKMAGIPVD